MTTPTVTPPEVEVGSRSKALLLATSTGDELAAAIQDLRLRGVTNPDEFLSLSVDALSGTVRWFDAQTGRVGAGVLVAELRAGGKPGWRPRRSTVDEQREYGERICDWLQAHFPEMCRSPTGQPHPAAVAAVIRLHFRDGKGALTKSGHGAEIRAAVRAFDAKWLEPATEATT